MSFDKSQAATGKETDIVGIGRDVTPDLHLVYGREIKGTEGNEVQVEYRVNKAVSLKTQVVRSKVGLTISGGMISVGNDWDKESSNENG